MTTLISTLDSTLRDGNGGGGVVASDWSSGARWLCRPANTRTAMRSERVSQVMNDVPPVGHLRRAWSAARPSAGVDAVSVASDDFHTAMMLQPLGLCFSRGILESSRRVDMLAQRITNPERDIGLEDAERLRNALQRGDENVFSVSLYVLLRAPTRRALDEATRRVETQLDGLLCHSRVALFEHARAFRSCLPEGRDQLLVLRNLDTSSLAISLPLSSSSLVIERGVLYGVADQGQSPIIIDPLDSSFLNYNLAVIAPSGSGNLYGISQYTNTKGRFQPNRSPLRFSSRC